MVKKTKLVETIGEQGLLRSGGKGKLALSWAEISFQTSPREISGCLATQA